MTFSELLDYAEFVTGEKDMAKEAGQADIDALAL
jgi:hypothetical protein